MRKAHIMLGLGLIMGLQACIKPPHLEQDNTMAARIYTDLAHHYWQQGYPHLAINRAELALQQSPDYAPAVNLLALIKAGMDSSDHVSAN